MKTKIFAYKDYVGVDANMSEGKFINDIKSPGQLGIVVSINEIEISKEAKDIIRSAGREGGSFAPLMLTKHKDAGLEHGDASIGVMGFGKIVVGKKGEINIGRTCDKDVLDMIPDSVVEPPEDFKEFIDSKK
jgi:hypothetical protein